MTWGGGVWRELYSFTYAYLRRRGVSHADAEDLAQDVLEAAVMHMDGVAPGKLHAWIAAVARNKLADRARRPARIESPGEIGDPVDAAADPAVLVMAADDARRLDAAIDSLTPRDAELVRLRYIRELSVSETARRVGSSVSATKVALMRARQRLRVLLEPPGGPNE